MGAVLPDRKTKPFTVELRGESFRLYCPLGTEAGFRAGQDGTWIVPEEYAGALRRAVDLALASPAAQTAGIYAAQPLQFGRIPVTGQLVIWAEFGDFHVSPKREGDDAGMPAQCVELLYTQARSLAAMLAPAEG
jgi:hypothetical protein